MATLNPRKCLRLSIHLLSLCVLVAVGLAPNFAYYKRRMPKARPPKETEPVGYALEVTPVKAATPTAEQRLVANAEEFERLREWQEVLRIQKRDLLHSDVNGNREYVVDLALYNQALAKANEERQALSK